MKNIHILPTDKPSRLYKLSNKLYLDITPKEYYKKYNIYITSDEEIKEEEEDWVIQSNFEKTCINVVKFKYYSKGSFTFNKIILTTDQDLIKNGVQSIDDEFLEWFVNNSSCEKVKVKNVYFHGKGYYDDNQLSEQEKALYSSMKEYKIIIPKEEPKPIHEQIIDAVGGEDRFREITGLKPKQETLEEAAKNYAKIIDYYNRTELKECFEAGAKWQQKQMYSEEDIQFNVNDLLNNLLKGKMHSNMIANTVNEWFEQFKKK